MINVKTKRAFFPTWLVPLTSFIIGEVITEVEMTNKKGKDF